jgi:hypothetical protein
MTYIVKVIDRDGSEVLSREVSDPDPEWLAQERVSVVEGVLISATIARCPYDCDRCRQDLADFDIDED